MIVTLLIYIRVEDHIVILIFNKAGRNKQIASYTSAQMITNDKHARNPQYQIKLIASLVKISLLFGRGTESPPPPIFSIKTEIIPNLILLNF